MLGGDYGVFGLFAYNNNNSITICCSSALVFAFSKIMLRYILLLVVVSLVGVAYQKFVLYKYIFLI